MIALSKLSQTIMINLSQVALMERYGDKIVIQMISGRHFQATDSDGKTWAAMMQSVAVDLSDAAWIEIDGR